MLVTGVLVKHSQDGPRPLAANPQFPLARETHLKQNCTKPTEEKDNFKYMKFKASF